ncbi:MAG: YbfB/YjiJ family MFS transporter, partial [Dongiaceae bacterium]
MLKAVQPVVPVLLGIILIEGALGIVGAVMGIQMAARNVPSALIGFVFSAYFVGFLAGSLTCERLIHRVGHIRAFGVFAVAASIATLLLAITGNIYAWFAFKIMAGYAIAGAFVVIESWLNDKASEDNRGRIFAVYMVVSWGASGLSPLALNLGNTYGNLFFQISTIMLAASMIPLA